MTSLVSSVIFSAVINRRMSGSRSLEKGVKLQTQMLCEPSVDISGCCFDMQALTMILQWRRSHPGVCTCADRA